MSMERDRAGIWILDGFWKTRRRFPLNNVPSKISGIALAGFIVVGDDAQGI